MGSMTREAMRDELTIALNNRTDTIVAETRKNLWLWQAYLHVCNPNTYRHRTLQGTATITLVADQGTYDDTDGVPTDLWATYSVSNTTRGRRLPPRDIRQIDEELERTGEPLVYALWGGTAEGATTEPSTPQLVVRDTPSSTYASDVVRMRYWRRPTVWPADSNATVISPEFDGLTYRTA